MNSVNFYCTHEKNRFVIVIAQYLNFAIFSKDAVAVVMKCPKAGIEESLSEEWAKVFPLQ
jgi:hypothetical protein